MINYNHLYRLSKRDLLAIIIKDYPHLAGSLYKCRKADLIAEIKDRKIL